MHSWLDPVNNSSYGHAFFVSVILCLIIIAHLLYKPVFLLRGTEALGGSLVA